MSSTRTASPHHRMRFKLDLDEKETTEGWQDEFRRERKWEEQGFGGDEDVVLLGLDEMEDRLERDHEGKWPVQARWKPTVTPVVSTPVEIAAPAVRNDVAETAYLDWDLTDE